MLCAAEERCDELCHKLVRVCPRRPELIPFKQLEVNRAEIQLDSKLGSGKFGEVWQGRHTAYRYYHVTCLSPLSFMDVLTANASTS